MKDGYTTGARSLASRSVKGLARTRVTPNTLTAAGVTLCLTAAVLVPFESRDKLLFYWLDVLAGIGVALVSLFVISHLPRRRTQGSNVEPIANLL